MLKRFVLAILGTALALPAALIPEVRALANKADFPAAQRLLAEFKAASGETPEYLEAMSWLGRGALANKQFDQAATFAAQTRDKCLAELKKRPMDSEPRLPIAFGASQEVMAQALAATGKRSEAVTFLNQEIKTYGTTSILTRMRKNLNLLTLEGRPAPPVAAKTWAYMGKPTIVFLWAHWCGDCKAQAPILAKLRDEFSAKGLTIVAPTKLYGYANRGEDATPEQEKAHIQKVLDQHYAMLKPMPVIIDADTFAHYGSSTTPTLVLVDRKGIVRLYHPGQMTYDELAAKLKELLPAS
ncbi:MAG: TlpA disulfide reductase family protein [Acidobacteria bacterium]|nr:TlpA disulfide reductase family protein [Acidobacteriota bacterium]